MPVGVYPAIDGSCVVAHGYGDYVSKRGYGCPLTLELHEGRLRLKQILEDLGDRGWGQDRLRQETEAEVESTRTEVVEVRTIPHES